MNKHTCISLAASLTVAALTTGMPAEAKDPPLFALDRGDAALVTQGKYVDQRIAEFMAANNIPGMTMAIVQAPYIPRSAGYGRASASYDELASTKTMWSIGPIAQAFTDVAVLQLYEQGKLDIRAPVGKYLSGLPTAWQPLTIYELMQHASGIPDYRQVAGFSTTTHYKPRDLIELVAAQPLQFEPGTQAHLSATNFALLAMVIEKTSGMSFEAFVHKYQIDPLSLHSTMFASELPSRSMIDRPAPDSKKNQHSLFGDQIPYVDPVEAATGYQGDGAELSPTSANETENLFGFSDLWSSAEDVSRWDIALAGNILVKKLADRELIYAPTTLKNGTVVPAVGGWEFTHHRGFMEIKGNAPGFSAYLSRFTAKDELVCVTLLTNRQGVELTSLARDIADAYMTGLGSGLDPDRVVNQESKFGVDETFDRLRKALAGGKVPVFATIDHADNATKAGLSMSPAKVVIFGNPAVGTKLMQQDIAVSLELPLRIAVWQDARGRTWVSYHDIRAIEHDYGIKDPATASAIEKSLIKLVQHAADVYEY